MTFHDIELPSKFLGFGSSMGPQHDTLVGASRNGYESRCSNWRHSRRRYDVVNRGLGWDDLRDLTEFVVARKGALYGFKVTDPMDFTTASNHVGAHAWNDVRIGTGDGTTTKFWLVKRYQGGSLNEQYEVTRRLHRTGDILSGLDNTPGTEGVDFTVDHTDGSVTYLSAPGRGVGVFAGCSFFVEVRFQLDLDDWLKNSLDDFEAGSISAPMIEEKVGTNQDKDRMVFDLGYSHAATSGTVQLEFQQGLVHLIAPASGMTARLPQIIASGPEVGHEATSISSEGGPYFVVFNNGTAAITLHEQWNGSWASIAANATVAAKTARKLWINGSQRWRAY